MPRTQTDFVCQQCASHYPQSYGRCPNCGTWGSLLESTPRLDRRDSRSRHARAQAELQTLDAIDSREHARLKVGVEEFDRVLGGGIVPGSTILLGGDPGVGKSTLMLQVCQLIAGSGSPVLYVTGEESPRQLKLRAERLSVSSNRITILAESDLDSIAAAILAVQPEVLIVDSIQTVRSPNLDSSPGSVSQVSECAARPHGDCQGQ